MSGTPTEAVTFAKDIKPLFRESDRTAMKRAFDLWSYDDVRAHADAIGPTCGTGACHVTALGLRNGWLCSTVGCRQARPPEAVG